MSEKREVKIVYRRWTIIVPIILIIIGAIIMFMFWTANALIALFGGMLVLIGVLSLGLVLVMVVSLELSTRSLKRQRPIPPALSEDYDRAEREKETEAQSE